MSDRKALKVFFAVHELTLRDTDLYVAAGEVAEKAKVSPEEVEEILAQLPVAVQEDEGVEKYRIEGSAAWLADVIRLIWW